MVLLAGIVVEHADDHKGVGASKARASLRLLDIWMVEKSEGVWGCGTALRTQTHAYAINLRVDTSIATSSS